MHRLAACAVAAAAVLVLPACLVSSLHPVYDDESIVFDESLVGTWENRESEVTVVIARGEWRSYHLAYSDRSGTTRFTGHLTTIGAARFLNVRPEDGLERPAYLIAANGPLQIDLDADRARVRALDHSTVLDRLARASLQTAAATDLKQNVVLTGSTSEVRGWLASAVREDTVFGEWMTFTRSRP